MKTIHKYPLAIADEQFVTMPAGARTLAVQFQGPALCLWAMVETDARLVTSMVNIRGTGHPCDDVDRENYVGTVQQGNLVWHVFFYPNEE